MKRCPENRKLSSNIADTVRCIIIALITVSVLFLSFKCFEGERLVYYVINISIVFSAFLLIFTKKNEYPIASKIGILVFILSVLCAVIYHFLVKLDLMKFFDQPSEIKNIILETGALGVLVFFFITFLQVVILPIPAAVTIIAGTLIYGPVISFFVSAAATFLGSVLSFWIGRIFGKKLMKWLLSDQKAKKYAQLLAEKGKTPFVIMMLLPFFPDDILCVLAGYTDMSFKFFSLSVLFARSVYILFMCIFGDGSIIPFSGWGIPVWLTIIAFIVALAIIINKKFNKIKK